MMIWEESAHDSAEIIAKFVQIVVSSPVAVVTLVLCWFCGYGISFIIFDYRKNLTICSTLPWDWAIQP
jgi:ABC-type glycerol-3-phosphate transport system permease component